MKPFLILALATTTWLSAPPSRAADPSCHMVEVLVTAQRVDPRIPWRRQRPESREGYGVIIAPGRVLTIEELVRNQTLVELRRAASGTKQPARVRLTDWQMNVALLEFDPPDKESLTPVALATQATRGTTVQVTRFDQSGRALSGEGRIAEVSVAPYPNGPTFGLMFTVLTDLLPDRPGAPVFAGTELAGLAMRHDRDNRTVQTLPAPVLDRFLADADKTPYAGRAAAGFRWAPLQDPAKRAFLQAASLSSEKGILVLSTIPGTGADEALRPLDVILQWDSQNVDSQGYVVDPLHGRILLPHLVAARRPGESVPVRVLRDGHSVDVSLRLQRREDRDALVPENVLGDMPAYLVEGGLVLRELTADYLTALGPRWLAMANPRLAHYYFSRGDRPSTPGERIVILAYVLPDPINVGYEDIGNDIVTAVNGRPIRNMQDVFRAVDEAGGLQRLSLLSYGVDVVLDPAQLPEANRRIAAAYRIPALRHAPSPGE